MRCGQIVLATCHTAGSRQILREDFDVVIIDEVRCPGSSTAPKSLC